MILLDTNVISELMGPAPEPRVAHWMDLQSRSSLWTTSINVYETRSGLFAMPAGKRRVVLEMKFEQLLQSAFEGRILYFDSDSALRAAELCADRRKRGRPMDEEIASSVVNPWEA